MTPSLNNTSDSHCFMTNNTHLSKVETIYVVFVSKRSVKDQIQGFNMKGKLRRRFVQEEGEFVQEV